jgi:predicted 3-demethylubiquinone-9 3-methyltransferase (glyoxalase superfamily)
LNASKGAVVQKINPFLWFNGQAEQAAKLYVSTFENARVTDTRRWGPGGPYPEGSVLSVSIELDGREYELFNGGPEFTFTEAVSLVVSVETQEEVDRLWDALTRDGGEPGQCGWLKDRFGLSWQIVPTALGEVLSDPDPERASRALQAMMAMGKLDIAELRAAADG